MENKPQFEINPAHEKWNAVLRVLVVEDDPDTATSLATLLGRYGHDVVGVTPDGPTALRLVQSSQPDVVLLDIGLPRMDGWKVAEQIRGLKNEKTPFLIAVTGYATIADQFHFSESGIDLHLVKPVDPEILRKVLARFHRVIMPGTD